MVESGSEDGHPQTRDVDAALQVPRLICRTFVVTSKGLSQVVEAAVRGTEYSLAADLALAECVKLIGPTELGKRPGGWRPFRESDGRRIREAIREVFSEESFPEDARAAIGVIVVDSDLDTLSRRMPALERHPDFANLPLIWRGVTLDSRDSPISSSTRLDAVLLQEIASLVQEIERTNAAVPVELLARLLPEVRATFAEAGMVAAVGNAGTEGDLRPNKTLIIDGTVDPTPPVEADSVAVASEDPYPTTESQPLRLTYVVAGWGLEARPRSVRRRLIEILDELEGGLNAAEDVVSRTTVIAASQGVEKRATVRENWAKTTLGTWRPSTEHLDITATMRDVAELVVENVASYERRSQALTKPLVIFLLPSPTLTGAMCATFYRKIKDIADVGWIVNGDKKQPSYEIDSETVVRDKEDAVNELLHTMERHPMP